MLCPSDIDLIRRDDAIEGLPTILDLEKFISLFGSLIPEAKIRNPEITYIRYAPQTSCLIGYKLEINETEIYVYAKAFTRYASHKLKKIREYVYAVGTDNSGVFILENQAILIFMFPNDSKLRSLAHLADSQSRKHLLQKILPESPEVWVGSLKSIAYKPERRFVARVDNEFAPQAVLKLYTPLAYQIADSNAKGLSPRGALQLARRLGRSGRHHIVAFEWIELPLLSDLLMQPMDSLKPIDITGAAIAELHAQDSEKLTQITPNQEVATLLPLASWISFLCPELANKTEKLVRNIASILIRETPVYKPIHGDFYAKQILVGQNRVVILDLDRAAAGNPSSDLGLFLAHLERQAVNENLSRQGLEEIKDSLLTGYKSVAHYIPDQSELYTAIGLLRLAPDPFRHREPDWPEKTEMLLERAEKTINSYSSRPSVYVHIPCVNSNIPVTDPFCVLNDPGMPFLSKTLNPVEAEHQLLSQIPYLKQSEVEFRLCAIRVVRYKPGSRCLIEYDLEPKHPGGATGAITLLGKIRAKGLDKRAYSILKKLRKKGFGDQSSDYISVPGLFGTVPEFNMYLQQKISGISATWLITGPAGIDLSKRIAQAIHKLHQVPALSDRCHTINDEIRILYERLPLVARIVPGWSQRLERLLHQCDRLAASVPQPTVRGIHRDFYADQVILDGKRIYLLDFDLYSQGDPGLDVGNFVAHITEFALRNLGDPNALADREKAMEKQFLELSGEEIRFSLHAYKLLSLVRHIYLSTQFPERNRLTESLLEICEKRLISRNS